MLIDGKPNLDGARLTTDATYGGEIAEVFLRECGECV
jgi:hypothetical protein